MRRLTVLLAALGMLVFAVPAQAESLLSGTLPGLVSPSDTPEECDTSTSQPFAPWGDTSDYVLTPGGAFEPDQPPWTLAKGARVVSGNEPFYVHSTSDEYSLYLPKRSSATSPPMCFAFGDWNLRFFLVGSGTVDVKIVVTSLLGVVSVLDGGSVSSGAKWKPSPKVSLLLSNVSGLLATDSISIRLLSGNRTDVRIDDVYLDPWKVG